jgi:hypothetical protein
MATSAEITREVDIFWLSWDGRGPEAREFDLENGHMRAKGREYKERQVTVNNRIAEFDEIRNKYKRKEK